jgi:diketogulonate reductase-like aldo/keto reductase
VQFSPFHFRRGLLDACRRLGVVLEAYSPLSRGNGLGEPVLTQVARELGRTPAQVMLRWALERDVPVIPKSAQRERIVENAQVFDFALPPEAMAKLDALDRTAATDRAR